MGVSAVILAASALLALLGPVSGEPEMPHGCAQGSCYPATGDLLVGRSDRLGASSTCGLAQPQPYCIVSHLQDEKKCFTCDSREEVGGGGYGALSHGVHNVITAFALDRKKAWWQSENGVENVTLRLDLEAEFHFTHLIMTFKTFRPASLLIERSADFGRTWQIYRYFAYDCSAAFPGVATGPLRRVDDVICESRYSDIEPSTEGEVIFRVLDPAIKITDPYSPAIQSLLKITNLRINFTRLHTLGDNLLDSRVEIKEKYYYALYELVVRGNCFCYGHASECAPIDGVRGDVDGMVHGRCVCKHNTEGLNCERCEDFYNDMPWRPAEGRNTNACKRCNCNNHAVRCHFDGAVFAATGNASGGVCEDCQHNTAGRSCELCKPFFYQDPLRDIRDAAVCVPCDCDPDGSLNGGMCDGHTDPSAGLESGQCRCKAHVEGPRCDQCRAGFYGLDAEQPDGCQPCHCNPLGTVGGAAACDAVTGECYCKRLVTGRSCDQCLAEHWGLSHDGSGCRPCECDVGGAVDNRCSVESGQCHCRGHMGGRPCSQPDSGFFCMALDHYTHEAETALPVDSNGTPGGLAESLLTPSLCEERERVKQGLPTGRGLALVPRAPTPGRAPTWTGPGFVRVPEGGRLEFRVSDVPHSMDYELLIRYEPQLPEEWEVVLVTVLRPSDIPTHSPCGNTIPADDHLAVSLPPGSRYVVLPQAVCLEKGVSYVIRADFTRYTTHEHTESAHVLIDSLVLLPLYTSLEMFSGDDRESTRRRDNFERYLCQESGKAVMKQPVTEVCAGLICSLSALLHDGALPCQCDLQGSLSTECDPNGGQCHCRPNVVGRRCDACAPGTYGFGPSGCLSCECSDEGSHHAFCDARTGQCRCRHGAYGRRCDHCQPGYWGFPACRPCRCNGHAEECHPVTGTCHSCREHTAGESCERCADGYYGNPVLGSGEQCRPCPCPGGPGSGRHFASSCHEDPHSQRVVCSCRPGYTGSSCEECAPGHHGNPHEAGGSCRPCRCHGNIDPTDPGSCDRRSGVCLRCLHHSHGPDCGACLPGFYGNATQQSCQRCACSPHGVDPRRCPPGGALCECDAATGQCPCRPHALGRACEHCAPGHWGLAEGEGCRACACDRTKALGDACNEFTGQCECQPGFGGRSCTECMENFWGNPSVECIACQCDARGISTAQCERATGHCVCRAGVAGVRCDTCARGFSGSFPHCEPCHQCFGDWDRIVQSLAERSRGLAERAARLAESGAVGAFGEQFGALEEKLAEVRRIVDGRVATAHSVTALIGSMEDIRKMIDELTNRLTPLEIDLTESQDRNANATGRIAELERDVRRLNRTAGGLEHQLDVIKNSNYRGAYDSVRQLHADSLAAESRANASVAGDGSPVGRSADARSRARALLEASRDDFRRKNAAGRDALETLADDVRSLSLRTVSEKVCGSPGDEPCSDSPCGGPGCRNEDGAPRCGGLGCNGAATAAAEALERARNADLEIQQAAAQVEELNKQVQDARARSHQARGQAEAALDRANGTRERAQRANAQLRALIQQIKDFLQQDSASPDDIELVSNRVLELSVPASAEQTHELAAEIKRRVADLANVDAILAQTSGDIADANSLLQEARDAKTRADDVLATAEGVKGALEDAEMAQKAAQEAINQAKGDIQGAQNTLASIASETDSAEQRLREAAERAARLDDAVAALKIKSSQAAMAGTRADKAAGNAKLRADEAKQILGGELREKFGLLETQARSKADGATTARQRAEALRDQARKLLTGAQDKLQRLMDLEEQYERNEQALEDKARSLDGLEEKMQAILHAINRQITVYNTCQ
ncbi:laminin subunit beta-2-like isoform X1 [Lampetra planeri]